jgi:sugar lactone lactonase YvrE
MMYARRGQATLVAAAVAIGLFAARPSTQADVKPTNDLPNPYQSIESYFKLPEGRTWGSTSAVDVDKDGRSIWVAERCGANTCVADAATGRMSALDPVLKFDASGKLVKSFGAGMIAFAHGIHVDRDGNIWVTDANDNRPRPARPSTGSGQAGSGAAPASAPDKPVGHQVFKFSPDGRVLMTLGKAGVAGDPPEALTEPNDVVTAPNGDIFVAEGHSGQNANATPDTVARISKFTKDGKFIKSWGKLGSAAGEFRTPHSIVFDSRGRLFVADRGNVRLQIFDQDGKFLQETKAFSRVSGIYIDKNDTLYAADSESSPTSHPGGWRRGIRIGSARDLTVRYLIPDPKNPDPATTASGTSAAEGVAVDAAGNVYGAEVGPKQVVKYVKRSGS